MLQRKTIPDKGVLLTFAFLISAAQAQIFFGGAGFGAPGSDPRKHHQQQQPHRHHHHHHHHQQQQQHRQVPPHLAHSRQPFSLLGSGGGGFGGLTGDDLTGGRGQQNAKGGSFVDRRRQQIRFGPFSAAHGHQAIFDDDSDDINGSDDDAGGSREAGTTDLRRKKIVMFDIFNLWQPILTLCGALKYLVGRMFSRLEAFALLLIDPGGSGVVAEHRTSTLIVSWIVLAAIVLLLSLVIRKICCEFSEIEVDEDDLEREDSNKKKAVNKKFKKRLTFAQDEVTRGRDAEARRRSLRLRENQKRRKKQQGQQQHQSRPGFCSSAQSQKRDEKSRLAIRWANLCLESLFNPGDDGPRIRFLEKWVEALNRHTEIVLAQVHLSYLSQVLAGNFCES